MSAHPKKETRADVGTGARANEQDKREYTAGPSDAEALAALRTIRAWLASGDNPNDPGALLTLADAARFAATSARVVRDAITSGELPGYGRQRDRSVRREDLAKWIEARRMPVERGADDGDIARRVARLRLVGGKERGQ